MIGNILYLTASYLDITFTVGLYVRYQASIKGSHIQGVKRIIKYVKETSSFGIWYSKDTSIELVCFSNAY